MTATILSLVVALIVGPAPATPTPSTSPTPDPTTSDEEDVPPEQRAAEMFEAGRYSEAARWFRIAHEQTGEPGYLYGRAQALRRAGNCQAAIEVLELFIDTSPPHADVVVAQDTIDACREILRRGVRLQSDADAPSTADPPDEVDTDPTATAHTDDAGEKSWRRDLAGGLLLGGGLLAASTGAVLTGSAYAVVRPRPEPETAFVRRQDRAGAMATSGIVLMATGSALVIGAIIRYVVVARRDKRTARRAPRPTARL